MSYLSKYWYLHSTFSIPIRPHNRHWDTQIHSHTTEELLLITSKGICTIDNNGSSYQVPTPAFIWNRAGSHHLVRNAEARERDSYVVSFLPKLLSDIPEKLRYSKFMADYSMFALPLNEERLKQLEPLFHDLLDRPTPQRQLLIPCIFHNILLFLKAGAEPICAAKQTGYIFDVLSLIENSVGQKFTGKELADRFHVSRSKLEADFKQVTGVSRHAFQMQVQLRSACLMLASTQQLQSEIATACGFSDESHMIRAFRKQYGVTPKEYRAQRKKDPRWLK